MPLLLLVVAFAYTGSPALRAQAPDPDLNNDGVVNILDLSIVGSCIGQSPGAVTRCAVANTDGDGDVDMADLNFVRAAFGRSGYPTEPPDTEPPTIVASLSPGPNAAGWNNSDVTVSFQCHDDKPGVVCPTPRIVATEGAAQTVIGTARDAVGKESRTSVVVNLDKTAPSISITFPPDGAVISDPNLTLEGTAADSLSGIASVTCGVTPATVLNESFTCQILVQGTTVTATATDLAGNVNADSVSVTPDDGLPPDPAEVASPIDPTEMTTIGSATEFLYSGPDPIQTAVAPGTIAPVRAAVLRGKVMTADGSPLPRVTISILHHEEYGETLSRADGFFDMAVNGGGVLTVVYQKDQWLSAQRKVEVPWQDFALLPDVALIQLDPNVAEIEFGPGAPAQLARGSSMSDSDGERRATLIFPEGGNMVDLVLPDSTILPAQAKLNVRLTEYTFGPNGPAAMPSELPPTTSYTYAVELSADEAIAAGATEVRFGKPVSLYIENFLEYPVGTVVPTGFLDRGNDAWVASKDGIILKILAESGGLAVIDVQGNGQAADAAVLEQLGFTSGEREILADLYDAGQELWRSPIGHFSPWDLNYASDCEENADCSVPEETAVGARRPLNDPCSVSSSIIECQNQTLGERITLVGTSAALNYRSDRVPGRARDYSLDIQMTGAEVPRGLQRIELHIDVAGRRSRRSFAPSSFLSHEFTWDGKDVYGRTLQGAQHVAVRIGYVYRAVSQSRPPVRANAFAARVCTVLPGPDGTQVICNSVGRARGDITLWRRFEAVVGAWDSRGVGLGGWTLQTHHTYDPVSKTLYRGDGDRRSAESVNQVIETIAGTGIEGANGAANGDGGPAIEARIGDVISLDVDSKGAVYVADNCRVRRVMTDGVIDTVAGRTSEFCSIFPGGRIVDGALATSARLSVRLVGIGPRDAIYFTENCTISRVDPVTNRIRVLAGGRITGGLDFDCVGSIDDGIPARDARVSALDFDVDVDGTVYFIDVITRSLRKIDPDGIISTVARLPTSSGGGLHPNGISVGRDGDLYLTMGGLARVDRMNAVGNMTVLSTGFRFPVAVDVGSDGSALVVDQGVERVLRVTPNGTNVRIAGTGTRGFNGDGGAATQSHLNFPQGIAVAPDDSIVIADRLNYRVRRVRSTLPGFSATDFAVPSEDGSELYQFDGNGRHLRTFHTLTGATLLSFHYDVNGLLEEVIDGDGLTTRIEHDGSGNPTAVIAAFGQRTSLATDDNGFLAEVRNPASEAVALEYTDDGLLQTYTSPRGNTSRFEYDSDGLLIEDRNADGGILTLERTEFDGGFVVSKKTALGQETSYQVNRSANGNITLTSKFPTGAQSTSTRIPNGRTETQLPNGMQDVTVLGPDPRWGMAAPLVGSQSTVTPLGSTRVVQEARTAELVDRGDPLSLLRSTDSVTINNRTFTRTFERATKTFSVQTPEGRSSSITIDELGRASRIQPDPALDPTEFTYTNGRLASLAQAGKTTTFDYEDQGRLEILTDAANQETRFQYDDADRVAKIIQPSGREIGFGYDRDGNLSEVRMPSSAVHELTSTPRGLPKSYAPPDNAPYSTAYDGDGRWDKTILPSGRGIDAEYDVGGRLTSIAYPEARIEVEYVGGTAQVQEVNRIPAGVGDAQALSFEYDGDRVTTMAWTGPPSGTYRYRYDADGAVIGRQFENEPEITYQYDDDKRITEMGPFMFERNGPMGELSGIGDGTLEIRYEYDRSGRLSRRAYTVAGTRVYEIELERDSMDRVSAKTEFVLGTTDRRAYGYDADGQLRTVSLNNIFVEQYDYDVNYNRTLKVVKAIIESASFDEQDRLTQQGNVNFAHDDDGYLVRYGTTELRYGAMGELLHASTAGTRLATYSYDGLRRLTARSGVSGVNEYFYGARNLRFQVTATVSEGATVSEYFYDEQGVLFALKSNGTWLYVASDHLGSPRLVVDSSGSPLEITERDDFGVITNRTTTLPAGGLPVGFAAGIVDPDSNLVRFGVRDYLPAAARWSSRDPLLFQGGGTNLYAYVSNDPVNSIDPNGQEILVCNRDVVGDAFSANHAYLWDTRGPGGTGPGVGFQPGKNTEELGPPTDECHLVEGSAGKEDAILDYLRRYDEEEVWRFYPPEIGWFPLLNDCHTAVREAIESQGLEYPGAPGGKFPRLRGPRNP